MKGSEQRLVEYMDGAKKRFVIPVYQRNYDWKMENCKQLFDDLVKIIRNGRKSHFFGSIVSVYNPDGRNSEYLIIDGQQRLTTVSLLFLAMYNLIENKIIVPKEQSLAQQLYEDFLVDKYQPKETRIKLKPVKNDSKAFGKLFDESSEHIQNSNLTVNYNYFYDRIQRNEISIDELFDAICRLEIISIQLNQDDNPQLIFESLNSTGLALSEGDKIRNFILMGLPTKQQEDFYEKYWNRSFTLDDDMEFTGKTIARFSYKGMEQPVTSWVDMYQQVLKILHAEDKSVLSGLAYTTDDSVELALHVSSKETDFSKCIQIDNNVFVWSNTSTQYKITTLRRFFSLYGADAGDLVFYMKDDQDDDSSIEGTRYEIRRRYWQFAIPLIQKAHEETGCFSLVTKSKENWIAGSYGVSGCSVTCVANFDSARVEIYLGTSDKMLNKKIFDAVFARKSVIESALSASLVWDRGEDKRSAKIAYELSGVSIANEDDWKRMASFHSEWSKKLYDEIVPIVLSAVQ